jgi:hypothetical protein
LPKNRSPIAGGALWGVAAPLRRGQ